MAAAYAVYMVQGHIFLDGNKRTAGATMMMFLQKNGGRSRPSTETVAGLMLELQSRSESGQNAGDLIRWIYSELRSGTRRKRK